MTTYSLYETLGDTESALEACQSKDLSSNTHHQYNRLILSFLSNTPRASDPETLLKQLEEWKIESEKRSDDNDLFATRKQRKNLIVTYNHCLVLCTSGRPREAIVPLIEKLRPAVMQRTAIRNGSIDPYARIGLLFLECILVVSVESYLGLQEVDETVTTARVVRWMESLDFESYPQLKFLLHLYKSRLEFSFRSDEGKLVDSRVRSVKKELRSAMEILNHKMRPAAAENVSVGDETASVGSNSEIVYQNAQPVSASIAGSSVPYSAGAGSRRDGLVQRHNQSALNLKAHFEQIKGNAKKSLVLCSEAQHLCQDSSYAALHNSNLGVTYGTCGKRHLALHAASKAISATESGLFESNGMASSVPTCTMLRNAAISALAARKFVSAYECMAFCMKKSLGQFQQARNWLRLAEACIGIYLESQEQDRGDVPKRFRSMDGGEGKEQRIMMQSENADVPSPLTEVESSFHLGSDEDIDFVKRNPLLRACSCLSHAAKSSEYNDKECYLSAMCSLAYVKLEMHDHRGCLDCALSVLHQMPPPLDLSSLQGRAHSQRLATIRIYACEACYALGRLDEAAQLISHGASDEKGDLNDLDRLAHDLSGVSTSGAPLTAQTAKARFIVLTGASALQGVAGNLENAKQFALGALQNAEKAFQICPDPTILEDTRSAREALLYCMMREENIDGALAVLRSV